MNSYRFLISGNVETNAIALPTGATGPSGPIGISGAVGQSGRAIVDAYGIGVGMNGGSSGVVFLLSGLEIRNILRRILLVYRLVPVVLLVKED